MRKLLTKKKPLKDVDSIKVSLFWKGFGWSFPFLGILGFVMYGIGGIFIAFLISLPVSALTLLLTGIFGGAAGRIYGGRRPIWSLHEQLAADLQQVRYRKMRREFESALRQVNEILRQHPEFPEALFLRAQILNESSGNIAAAKRDLKKVMQIVTDRQNSIYRYAETLYNDLCRMPVNPGPHQIQDKLQRKSD